jgi:hypothetical protein
MQFLEAAARRGIEPGVAGALFDDLYERRNGESPTDRLSRDTSPLAGQSGLTRIVEALVWLGTLLVIGAHAWWSTLGYQSIGIGVVLALTLIWQCGFLVAAERSRRQGYGLLEAGFAAIVVFYTPLTAYSIERLLGFHFEEKDFDNFYPYVSGGWVWMELAAIAAAVLALARYRRPFLMLPLTLFVGFLAMDAGIRIVGGWDHGPALDHVVLACGIGMVIAGVALDYRGWRRFAFWPHLAAIWLVTWSMDLLCDSRSIALVISAAVALILGVWLARILYLAIGGVLAWSALALSAHGALFPFLLMIGGLGFIGLAIWLARSDSPVRRWLAARGLPAPQRDLAY